MGKLKIILVSDIYYPHVGGVSEHIYHLANKYEEMGHRVTILTARMKGEPRPDENRVVRLGESIIIPANQSCSRITYKVEMGKFSTLINRYDIVHIHGILAPTLPMLALKASRKTNIFTFHPTFKPSMLYKILKKYLKQYFDLIDGKIAVSRTARNSIARYFPGNYRIIPNGVDVKRFTPAEKEKKQGKDILYVGRIEPRKGIQYLINAMALVKEKIPGVKLRVAGKGYKNMKIRIPDEIRGSIEFLGFVSPDELPDVFRNADVFVSPAISGESFGIVLIEAMASGVPVLASDIPGYRCVIRNGINGLLFEPKNERDIADKIIEVFENKILRDKLKRKGLESAHYYSWERIAERILDFYYEVDPSLS